MIGNYNILIGNGAGSQLTTEDNRIIVKSKSVNIDDTLSDREYKLVRGVIDALFESGYCAAPSTHSNRHYKVNEILNKL